MEAPPRPPRRKGSLVVGILFVLIALTAAGALFVRAKFGPAQACDYGGGPASCGENQICAISVGGQGRCLPFASQSSPMAPPFAAGVSFACTQGPRAPKERSHAWATDVFAVDLMPVEDKPEVEVVAPVAGEAHVFDRCEERDAGPSARNDTNCGAGYGNHVRIWDGTDLVLLGHLARVTVKQGAQLKRGDVLGIAGASGQAASRHVHLVVTRLRPGDHIGAILGSPGHKGGVVVRGLLEAKKLPGGAVESVAFDALECAEKPSTWWTAP